MFVSAFRSYSCTRETVVYVNCEWHSRNINHQILFVKAGCFSSFFFPLLLSYFSFLFVFAFKQLVTLMQLKKQTEYFRAIGFNFPQRKLLSALWLNCGFNISMTRCHMLAGLVTLIFHLYVLWTFSIRPVASFVILRKHTHSDFVTFVTHNL